MPQPMTIQKVDRNQKRKVRMGSLQQPGQWPER